MTSANLTNDPSQALQTFRSLDVDEQLALLWFIYTKMGTSITTAAPGAAGDAIAEGLYNQVKEMSHEEQLQVQRDLLSGTSTTITREYGSLSVNTKLLFWYRLAQGMESATIVPMPPNYQLQDVSQNLLSQLENFDFEQQITFLRDTVAPTGSEPQSTGL